MLSTNKALWYLGAFKNFSVVCVRTLIYCIVHPREFYRLFFLLFSTLNEFDQVSFGRLRNFEETPVYQRIKREILFCHSNVFNMEAIVTRPNETQILATL